MFDLFWHANWLCRCYRASELMVGLHRKCFFFNATATTEIYTLSLHDALPICLAHERLHRFSRDQRDRAPRRSEIGRATSELQSPMYLVCRLLLEKKKQFAASSNRIH